MKVLERLKTELSNQNYFNDETYTMYLSENNLKADDEYIKEDMKRDLLLTCIDILESISNDIDLMRKITDGSTEFSTDSAYKQLRQRIQDLKIRINEIPAVEEDYSNVQLLFYRGRR